MTEVASSLRRRSWNVTEERYSGEMPLVCRSLLRENRKYKNEKENDSEERERDTEREIEEGFEKR